MSCVSVLADELPRFNYEGDVIVTKIDGQPAAYSEVYTEETSAQYNKLKAYITAWVRTTQSWYVLYVHHLGTYCMYITVFVRRTLFGYIEHCLDTYKMVWECKSLSG